MKNNNKIGVMLTIGDRSTMLFGVASIEENTKRIHISIMGALIRNNSNILKKLQFRATTFICDHFDIVYYFQGLEYTFK
jgi:hypothetical protein